MSDMQRMLKLSPKRRQNTYDFRKNTDLVADLFLLNIRKSVYLIL